MRRPIVAGNWKMNKNITEALEFITQLPDDVLKEKKVECVICPPFIAINPLYNAIKETSLTIGGQNMHWEEKGAFTGEVAPGMLVASGCKWVIIGHSERRQYFAENDVNVNLKIKSALKHDLQPIICVGEKLAEREANQTDMIVSSQVNMALSELKINSSDAYKIVIAYEPVWAIGVGAKPCSSVEANRVIGLIRNVVKEKFSSDVADNMRILYGGNVNPANIKELMTQPEIDGGLVGGASLKPDSFSELVRGSR